MSALADLIVREIRASGPMDVARYMALCLGHPEHGYYITRDPLGRDFTTAPEISQMFGEILGVWLLRAWQALDRPTVRLVELGPGRGTLMADALRVLRPRLGDRAEVWFVETSPVLRAEQARRVPHAQWADALDAVPHGPMLLLANEFLDALPVRQLAVRDGAWRARQVGIGPGERLAWGVSGPLPGHPPAPEGTWAEQAPRVDAIVGEIAARLARDPGAALIVDYGYTSDDRPAGWTLQAVAGGRPADPLDAPGDADLTWLLDFDHLAGLFAGCAVSVTGQGAFLAANGIGARAESLARAAPDRVDAIADALTRLTDPSAMGTLFKVLSATSRRNDAAPDPI